MKKTKIVPVGKKVLIRPKEVVRTVPGTNIIIPDSALEKEYKGFVVGVGAEVQEIVVDDLVQYAEYSVPQEVEHNGSKHLLINAGDVFAIIKEIE